MASGSASAPSSTACPRTSVGRTTEARTRRSAGSAPPGRADLPLVLEFQHASWHVDETFAALRDAGAILCTTETPEDASPPDIRVTGTGLYLRLRRHDYTPVEIEAWARRLEPFLDAGHPAFVFFRHDSTGRATELAADLARALGGRAVGMDAAPSP